MVLSDLNSTRRSASKRKKRDVFRKRRKLRLQGRKRRTSLLGALLGV